MEYKFKLPVGDWSDDGHGKCDYYIVDSNKEPKDLIDAFNAMDEKYHITRVCSEYEEYNVNSGFYEQMKIFIEDIDSIFQKDEEYITFKDGSESMAKLTLQLMMLEDETLKLEIVEDDSMPEFNNWFAQSQGKSLESIGYGLFD